jgi:predicted RNase H-related nuclease YkuK (DUF458 family)
MYTVEVYKTDKRSKKGERLVRKTDHSTHDRTMLEHLYKTTYFPSEGFRFEIHETIVTRRNAITGQLYEERYDTPWACSPSSEAYWSA